jgi:F0F1-type ATP synthase membrane subunit c/vacuolar-type H+-ATPase subunit K
LFWLGYRRTTGVRDERIRVANQEMVAIFVRRTTIEKAAITVEDVERVRNAKAYKYQINPSSLLGPYEIADQVYCSVIENEFIDAASKQNIITTVSTAFKKSDQAELGEIDSTEKRRESKWVFIVDRIAIISGLFGVIAAALGSKILANIFDSGAAQNVASQRLEFILIILVATIVIFAVLAALLRTLRKVEESKKQTDDGRNYQFIQETAILNNIKDAITTELVHDKTPSILTSSKYADLVVRDEDKRALIEVQADLEAVDIEKVIDRMRAGVRLRPGSKAFIVSERVPEAYQKLSSDDIELIPTSALLGKLKEYLQSAKAS